MYEDKILEIIKSDELIEPETIRQMFPTMDDSEIDKLMALTTLYHTRHMWENFYIFEDIVLALNNVKPDFAMVQGSSPEQIWYAIEIAHQIFPTREFAPEILKYVEFMFNRSGVFVYPPFLELLNPYYAAAHKLALEGPFPIGDNSVEEIQAGKLLGIYEYLKEKNK
jgi:hypothetical protein